MIVNFKTKKLGKTFNSAKELAREYGKKNSRAIMRRMAVIRAAVHLGEISHKSPTRRHELTGSQKGEFAVDLDHPFRLVFKPNHNPLPVKDDGGLDLSKITNITILRVEDYH